MESHLGIHCLLHSLCLPSAGFVVSANNPWWTSLVAQIVKRLPTVQETRVPSLGWEDPLEKEMATHSSILAWKIPRTEDPGRLHSLGSQRVRHNWATWLSHTNNPRYYQDAQSTTGEPSWGPQVHRDCEILSSFHFKAPTSYCSRNEKTSEKEGRICGEGSLRLPDAWLVSSVVF